MKRSAWAISIATCLVLAAPAGAATQVGETFIPDVSSNCGDSTWLQDASPGDQYTIPFSGVITSWKVKRKPS